MRALIFAGVNILSQVIQDNYKVEYVKINKNLIPHIRKHPKDGRHFQKPDLDTMKILFYFHVSFSTNNDGSPQLGNQIFLADNINDANIIDFESDKSRRVLIASFGAETFRLFVALENSHHYAT